MLCSFTFYILIKDNCTNTLDASAVIRYVLNVQYQDVKK